MPSTWFAERVVDLYRSIGRMVYARKYGAMAQQLGRPAVVADTRRGFIIVQIDGLSYDHFEQAVAGGRMPNMARMLASGRVRVAPWRCGIPSSTPAVQAGIMFGNREDIPGFRWYDKVQRSAVVTRWPDHARDLRAQISRGRTGILQGGSCYVSVFDGDADLALFTLSTLHSQRFFESVRGMGLFLLFLLSPFRLLRLLALTLVAYLARVGRRVMTVIHPGVVSPFDILSPLLHSVSDVLFTEVQTYGVTVDIYRGVPAIYANYTSYDEAAHHYGPAHPAAFRTLRGIDHCIGRIDHMRNRPQGASGQPERTYDLYVLSDHGNAASVPFTWLNGTSLGRYIVSLIDADRLPEGGVQLFELTEAHPYSADKARYLMEELRVLERRMPPRLRRVFVLARLSVRRRLLAAREQEFDLSRQGDVVVSTSGPLAHVYFGVSAQPLDLLDVMVLYPHMLDRLLETPGIGAVAGRAEGHTLVLGQGGGVLSLGHSRDALDGPHPLAPFGDPVYAEKQLHRLVHFAHAGDLVVLGAVQPDGCIVTFEKQMATHGGLGGVQTRPFIACGPEQGLAAETLNDSEDLYPYFTALYLKRAAA